MNYNRIPRRKIETDSQKSIFLRRVKNASNKETVN
jgi:hypothetical protein